MVVQPLVTIYVVTYRRPHLLSRALQSLVKQTHTRWLARVVNDDPEDARVLEVMKAHHDDRISLYEPVKKRGAAANFNLAFQEKSTPYASLLEDDNWWEPEFLSRMLEALSSRPECELACANEIIWEETAGGEWKATGMTIWPQTAGVVEWSTPFDACGSAKLCNSSLLFRTANSSLWQTPNDLPVDVTEHFRERCVPQPLLLVHEPLANYAVTLVTHRSVKTTLWGDYQCLLIGSCFSSLPPALRTSFAQDFWQRVGSSVSPRATVLLLSALAIREARALWSTASVQQKLRLFLGILRRPLSFFVVMQVRERLKEHWNFLCHSPYNQKLAACPDQMRIDRLD